MKHKHHTQTARQTPESIQAVNEAGANQAMTVPDPSQYVHPGTIAPSQDYWAHQLPTPALGSSTING